MEIKRLFDILTNYEEKFPNQGVALAGKKEGKWVKYSLKDYVRIANNLSYAFIKLGVQKGEKVAIILNNCPEWNMLDMAIMQTGAITVPIYPTITEHDYEVIINHADVKCLVMDGVNVIKSVNNIKSRINNVEKFYTLQSNDGYESFDDLVKLGEDNPVPEILEERRAQVDTNDIATIIYTSGTTGEPKGVVLSHSNIVNQFMNLVQIPSKWSNIAYSFLPLCHAYERMLVFLYQQLGMSIYYAQNFGTIADDLKEINPTMMSAVPRLLEKVYDKIIASGNKLKGVKKKIFFWAVELAKQYKIEESERSAFYNLKLKLADKLVYSQIRQNVGGNFDIIVSGAASIQKHLVSFFSAIKMDVFEGYGLTETSPVIAVSCREKYGREAGTVGFPISGIEVKVDPETQELCCRGHNVMQGYYKNPELTAEVIDKDGWFHTGDMAKITDKGQIVICGRIKSLFKTSNGKFINPESLESKICQSKFIETAVVVGEGQKFAGALIVPDFNNLKLWCAKNKVKYTNPQEIIKNQEVRQFYWKEVESYNVFFGATEKIKKIELVADEWTPQNGILTPTLKVKRNEINKRYKDLIDAMFNA